MTSYAFPQTAQQWQDLGALLMGGARGWVMTPAIWLVWPLWRFWALLIATASQEGGWDRLARAAGGEDSVGLLQFHISNVDEFFGGDELLRTDPGASGMAAAAYLSKALTRGGWQWWTMLIPGWGYVAARWAWRVGVTPSAARRLLSSEPIDMVFRETDSNGQLWERRGLVAFAVWSVLLTLPSLLVLAWLVRKYWTRKGR